MLTRALHCGRVGRRTQSSEIQNFAGASSKTQNLEGAILEFREIQNVEGSNSELQKFAGLHTEARNPPGGIHDSKGSGSEVYNVEGPVLKFRKLKKCFFLFQNFILYLYPAV